VRVPAQRASDNTISLDFVQCTWVPKGYLQIHEALAKPSFHRFGEHRASNSWRRLCGPFQNPS